MVTNRGLDGGVLALGKGDMLCVSLGPKTAPAPGKKAATGSFESKMADFVLQYGAENVKKMVDTLIADFRKTVK